jgi:hypothetical protein
MKLHHLREYLALEKTINVQLQENASNIAGGQSGAENMYSDSPFSKVNLQSRTVR